MLRPWVPLIAVALLMAISWRLGSGFLAMAGGGLLALALLAEVCARLVPAFDAVKGLLKRRQTRRRTAALDWSIIEGSLSADRPKRDCERPETLGLCTGLDCLVYKTCNFNIKKPMP